MLVVSQTKLKLSLAILAITTLLALFDTRLSIGLVFLLGIIIFTASYACLFFQKLEIGRFRKVFDSSFLFFTFIFWCFCSVQVRSVLSSLVLICSIYDVSETSPTRKLF